MTLLEVAGEADTVSQNVAELLREYADGGDQWAADLLEQVKALGDNARAAIKQVNAHVLEGEESK